MSHKAQPLILNIFLRLLKYNLNEKYVFSLVKFDVSDVSYCVVEPNLLHCTKCPGCYVSAWALLKHIHKDHKMLVYKVSQDEPATTQVKASAQVTATAPRSSSNEGGNQSSGALPTSSVDTEPSPAASTLWNIMSRPQDYALMSTDVLKQLPVNPAVMTVKDKAYSDALRCLAGNRLNLELLARQQAEVAQVAKAGGEVAEKVPQAAPLPQVPSPGLKCETCDRVFHYEVLFEVHKRQHTGKCRVGQSVVGAV